MSGTSIPHNDFGSAEHKFIWTEAHRRAAGQLEFAVNSLTHITLMLGKPGVGKSRLVEEVVEYVMVDQAVAFFTDPRLLDEDLVGTVRKAVMGLADTYTQNATPIFVIDDAHRLHHDTLTKLIRMSHPPDGGGVVFKLVLVAHSGFDEDMQSIAPGNTGPAFELWPLDEKDADFFVDEWLRVRGHGDIFEDDDQRKRMLERADGVPGALVGALEWHLKKRKSAAPSQPKQTAPHRPAGQAQEAPTSTPEAAAPKPAPKPQPAAPRSVPPVAHKTPTPAATPKTQFKSERAIAPAAQKLTAKPDPASPAAEAKTTAGSDSGPVAAPKPTENTKAESAAARTEPVARSSHGSVSETSKSVEKSVPASSPRKAKAELKPEQVAGTALSKPSGKPVTPATTAKQEPKAKVEPVANDAAPTSPEKVEATSSNSPVQRERAVAGNAKASSTGRSKPTSEASTELLTGVEPEGLFRLERAVKKQRDFKKDQLESAAEEKLVWPEIQLDTINSTVDEAATDVEPADEPFSAFTPPPPRRNVVRGLSVAGLGALIVAGAVLYPRFADVSLPSLPLAVPADATDPIAEAPVLQSIVDLPVEASSVLRAAIDLGRTDGSAAAAAYAVAAAKGESRAAYYLGQMYESGEGVAQDPRIALLWYDAAADQIAIAGARADALRADLPSVDGAIATLEIVHAHIDANGSAFFLWDAENLGSETRFELVFANSEGTTLKTIESDVPAHYAEIPSNAVQFRVFASADDKLVSTQWMKVPTK